ncbi:MAG TPA: class I SAM-dependent methyltransferase [Candidatus Paceibacterota bacterium]|nr:class I SAM-dependent methyltransferase [Candidatus Paceibacterota bacterium]
MTKIKNFWNDEYKKAKHLTLSDEPSEDFQKFVRWALRNSEWPPFPQNGLVVDLGCGNGRNIIALCSEAKMKGIGIDISGVALSQARSTAGNLPIEFLEQSITEPIPAENESVDVVLDMMTSHFLNEKERKQLLNEIVRVMKPYGWLYFKTFILEDDQHAKRLIEQYPSGEHNSYIHPRIQALEHVWEEDELIDFFSPHFKIYKMLKSFKHITNDGKPYKRRTISLYMEKKRD